MRDGYPCVSEVLESIVSRRMAPNTFRSLYCVLRLYPPALFDGEPGDAYELLKRMGLVEFRDASVSVCRQCSREAVLVLAFYAASLADTPLNTAWRYVAMRAGRVTLSSLPGDVRRFCDARGCSHDDTLLAVAFLFALRKLAHIDGYVYPRTVYTWALRGTIPDDAYTLLESCSGLEVAEYISGVAEPERLCTHLLRGVEANILGRRPSL